MFDMITRWYKNQFSDPHIVGLVATLILGFITIYFFGHLLAPLLVAIVLAYLLEWPVSKLSKLKIPRILAIISVLLVFIGLMLLAIFIVVPTMWAQIGYLINDIPRMYNELQKFINVIPERYPELVNLQIMEVIITNIKNQSLTLGENIVKGSLSSLISIVTLGVYLILVPLLVFFLLKDKYEMFGIISRVLPKDRSLAIKVWQEMNEKISNYIRGKVLEIVIIGGVSYIAFAMFNLKYAVLLAVAIGFSVLIPYIGAALVTIPVIIVGLHQWGISSHFYWFFVIYMIIQILDGNLLVPILFSEAVNLHPVVIIIAILFFGGLWGFWGVFFAIPLATLVKAVWNVFTHDNDLLLSSDLK